MGAAARLLAKARRRRARPDRGLHLTHLYGVGDSGFDVGDAFPDRSRPITVAVDVRRDGDSAIGTILDLGIAGRGIALWIGTNGANVGAAAGFASGEGGGTTGVTLNAANVLAANTQVARLVFACIPGNGSARLWVNGVLAVHGAASGAAFSTDWGDDGLAGIGEVQDTVSNRVPVLARVTLADASIVSDVRIYQGQTPRAYGP